MATLNEDIEAFLDASVGVLTNLHVKAAGYAGVPEVQAAFDDLASVPGALIEQAQQLKARLDGVDRGESDAATKAPAGDEPAKAASGVGPKSKRAARH